MQNPLLSPWQGAWQCVRSCWDILGYLLIFTSGTLTVIPTQESSVVVAAAVTGKPLGSRTSLKAMSPL